MPVLVANGEITTTEAIAITNKSPQRVWQQFVALVDAGILSAVGEKKGRWLNDKKSSFWDFYSVLIFLIFLPLK